MKVKKLEALNTESGYVWGTLINPEACYDYSLGDKRVRFCQVGSITSLGSAQTLEEADKLVQDHHEQEVKELLAALLEPPQWQTGPVPGPTGYSILFMEFKNKSTVPAQELPSFFNTEENKWQWYPYKPLFVFQTEQLNYTGRWYIQPIVLPTPSQQAF